MSTLPDPTKLPPAVEQVPYDRAAVIASRNRVVGLLLGGLVLLFFAITIVKMKI